MTANYDTTWRVVKADQIRWRVWDNQAVVFHPPSGNTHLLNVVAAEVLRSLQRKPDRAEELLHTVAATLLIPAELELLEQIEGLLREFDEAGLIEQVEP